MPAADPHRLVKCIKLGQELPALASQPFPNDVGKLIFEHVSKQAWDQWIQESVRYINTYHVDLSSKDGMEFMIQQMMVWFGFQKGELAQTAWTPPQP